MALEPRVMLDGAMVVTAAAFQAAPEGHAAPAAHADASHDLATYSPAAMLPGEGAHAISDRDAMEVTVAPTRSEEQTSELQSLMRMSYAVSCLTKKITQKD